MNKPKTPSPYVDRNCKPAPPLPPKQYKKSPGCKPGGREEAPPLPPKLYRKH